MAISSLTELQSLKLSHPVSRERHFGNIEHTISLGLPTVDHPQPVTTQRLNIAAGGPSLAESIKKLRKRKFKGDHIMCVNGVHDYLIERKIIPDSMILLDPVPKVADFLRNPHPDVVYFVCSCCDKSVFEALEGHHVIVWHAHQWPDDIMEGTLQVAGGCTAALRGINLGHVLGFRDVHFYGLDSCFEDSTHAYEQACEQNILSITAGGKTFKATAGMTEQVMSFFQVAKSIGNLLNVTVHGNGVIAHLLRQGPGQHDCQIDLLEEKRA
jgi:hypothetical protein